MALDVQFPARATVTTGAISLTVGVNGTAAAYGKSGGSQFRILGVFVHFNTAPTQNSLTITLDSQVAAAYDTLLVTDAIRATDFLWLPDGELVFQGQEDVVIAFTNTDNRTVGITVQWAKVLGY